MLGAVCDTVAQARKSGAPRRIGMLQLGARSETLEDERAFWKAMAGIGWNVDGSVVVERGYADGDRARLAALAAELVRKRVDLILTFGQAAPVAAARASQAIPIVFFGALWPKEQGLIDSFDRPARNATGIASYTGIEVTTKRLEFLREIVPAAKRLSWVWPSSFLALETVSGHRVDRMPMLVSAGRQLGFESRFHALEDGRTLESIFAEIVAWGGQAITGASNFAVREFADLALRHRLPSGFLDRENVVAGCLLSYGVTEAEWASLAGRRLADYVDRILRGTRPGDLPVEQPSSYELVINRKTAQALGLAIPQSLLQRANEIID